MGQYGMPLPGQPRMENTKPIITINHLLEGSPISRQVVAPPIPRCGADPFPPRHSAPVALAAGSTGLCIGYKLTTWSMTTVGTTRETILKHQSVFRVKIITLITIYIQRILGIFSN